MSNRTAVTPEQFTSFGELLNFLRHRVGMNQRELSIAVNYSEAQISRLEHNQRAPNAAILTARFVPALELEREPEWTARLLELAASSRGEELAKPSAYARTSPPHNLPLQLTSFIGRETEIAKVKRHLSEARLVTLTGTGGVGKTRLALQAGRESLNEYVDGVRLVELAPLADATLVPLRVASVFELREEPSRPVSDTLIHYLRTKHLMLLIDNCEHLIGACAQLSEALLRACPNVHILATSREPLGIPGERSYSVPSLDVPDPKQFSARETDVQMLSQYDAVRLFVERARDVALEFKLTSDNALNVAQVVRQLDGIPLAIELAAARVKMMSVEQIAERLDDRFLLLTGGSRTALPRHQTLGAMIDWSYDVLSEPERVLLQRLSVFAGGWTLEAAEAVCWSEILPTESVVHVMGKLVDKSLVVFEEESDGARYRMLEIIRQYALERLNASGEADGVRRQHAEYFLMLAEGARSDSEVAFYALIRREDDNLRTALAWSLLGRNTAELSLRLVGVAGWPSMSEVRSWLERALAHSEGVVSLYWRAMGLFYLGTVLGIQGDQTAAQDRWSESLALFQELGNRQRSAMMLERLGWLAREYDDPKTARERLEESIALSRELDDKQLIAGGLNTLGEVAVVLEDAEWASRLLEEGLALAQEIGFAEAVGWSLNHLGHVAQLKGDYEVAIRLHKETLPLFREIGQWNGVADAYMALGETELAQGDSTAAKTHFKQTLELFRDRGAQRSVAWCLAGLAGVAALEEEPERAAFLWGAAEALRHSIRARHAPASRATREHLMAKARAQLRDEVFKEAWERGARTATDEVVADVLNGAFS